MIEEIIKKLLVEVVMKAVMARIVAAVPFLGFPIIGPIFSLIMGKVFNMVGDELVLMIKLKQIELKVGKENDEYKEAVNNLKIEVEKPEQDQQKINEAKEKAREALKKLIDFNSSNIVR